VAWPTSAHGSESVNASLTSLIALTIHSIKSEKVQRNWKVIYSYRILGRSPGNTNPVLYSGMIEAVTSKQAIINALAREFGAGDSEQNDALGALTKSGWLDSETLAEQIGSLGDDDESLCLNTGAHTFDVEVRLLIEPSS